VKAFDGTTLTIGLAVGGTLTATVGEEGDEDDADDESWDDAELGDCGADIAPGTPVHEAEVVDGVFAVLELLTSGE
jgi:hypothetical protein